MPLYLIKLKKVDLLDYVVEAPTQTDATEMVLSHSRDELGTDTPKNTILHEVFEDDEPGLLDEVISESEITQEMLTRMKDQ